MLAKLARPGFMRDMRPLLPAAAATELTDDGVRTEFIAVFQAFIWRLPGASWERLPDLAGKLGVPGVLEDASQVRNDE